MPPRKRKSASASFQQQEVQEKQPPAATTTTPSYLLPVASAGHAALHQIHQQLLQQKRDERTLEQVHDLIRNSNLQDALPADKDAADSVLQAWVLAVADAAHANLNPDANLEALFAALDISLCAMQAGLCNDTFLVWTLEVLFESFSVHLASILFGWVELRAGDITRGLDPRKAKALTLLRTFNELLRRLSKTNNTVFCGRILMFLAASFPLGDQSSVNLKGAFDVGNVTALHEPDWGHQEQVQQEDGQVKTEHKEPDFYTVFWSMQRIFAFPPNLLKSEPLFPYTPPPFPSTPSSSSSASSSKPLPPNVLDLSKLPNLAFLRYAIDRTLSTFQDANKKDKQLSGAASKSSSSAKSQSKAGDSTTSMDLDDAGAAEHIKQHYFFPKFLTSRGLLDLQVADANFRRQILVQLLVTLQFLRGYCVPEKERAAKIPKPNKGLIPQVAIADAEMSWIAQMNQRTHTAIRETQPDGDAFDATVILVLQREQHWIRWKLASCQDFVKTPLDRAAASEEAKEKKRRLLAPPRPLQWRMGTPGLTQLWSVTGDEDPLSLDDLDTPIKPVKSIEYFRAELKAQTEMQEERKAALTGDSEPTLKELQSDAQWLACEERKASLSWRALRLLAPDDLPHFSKMNKHNSFARLIEDIENTSKAETEHAERRKDNDKSVPMADVEAAPATDAQEDVKSGEATPQEQDHGENPAQTETGEQAPANEPEQDSTPIVDDTAAVPEAQGQDQAVDTQSGEDGKTAKAGSGGDAVQEPATESTEVEMSG